MGNMSGKRIIISGMPLEIVSDDNDRWKCRNLTTKEIVFMDKKVIQHAIKLGKAEALSD